jgi:transposase
VLGASNFTYAEASWTQALGDWIGAHIRAFAALGGVPNLLVPDNTKVAVIKACLYEPQVNRTYAEMAAHYDTAILPARPYRPRDKAKVEAAVLIIERWLLGRLRHRRFHGLAELNATISEMLRQLNEERPIRRLGVTRRALFEQLDRPNLKPLPAAPYAFAEWRLRRVGVDYHVEIEDHYYSVPHRFARSEVEVRLTPQTVEVFLKSLPLRRQGASALPRICARAAITGTPPCPSTCRRAIAVMPTGPSSAFAARRQRSARPPRLCAS